MLKKGTTIVSAANFKTHISKYLKEIDKDQEPVFLTVNGEGNHVVMHIDVYDELRRYKQYCLEHGIYVDTFKCVMCENEFPITERVDFPSHGELMHGVCKECAGKYLEKIKAEGIISSEN